MRYWIGLVWPLMALGGSGCGAACELVGCWDQVEVDLVPELSATYDVTLLLDGEAGAFTCELDDDRGVGVERDVVGSAESLHWGCRRGGFWLEATPEAVEITVNAQDGSWSGSASLSPTYQTHQPNGPDCEPTCRVASVTIANEVTAFEVRP